MSEAKNTIVVNSRASWAGLRAVFQQCAFSADAGKISAAQAAAAASGFDGVEWVGPEGVGTLVESLHALAKTLPESTDRRCGVATRVKSTDLEAVVHDLNEALTVSGGLGATCLSVTLPPIKGRPDPTMDPGATGEFARYQDQLNFAFQILHRLRFTAERSGVALAVEGAVGGGLLSPVELREIIDEANSASVGVCIDVDRIAQVGSTADWITTLGRRVRAVRFGRADTAVDALDALVGIGFDQSATVVDAAIGASVREALGPFPKK